MLAVLTVAGCTRAVDGSAQRTGAADPPAPHQLLPSPGEVAATVGSPLEAAGPPKTGGVDVLPDGIRDAAGATPLDCLGAVTPLMRVVYEGAGDRVRAAAWRDYSRFGAGLTVSSVEAGVVQMDSAAAAARLFAHFAEQWRVCEGTTVTLHAGSGGLELTATDVRLDSGVLSATVRSDGGEGTAYPIEHAVGVAGEYLVDVDVAITDPDPARRVPASRAADLVRTILEKISPG